MSLKIEFVERATAGEKVSVLAKEFGITRAAGYKWLKRYKQEGPGGLEERSRRPKSVPLASAEDIVLAVLRAREAHPTWGPRKLEELLRRKLNERTPSERTIARILKRAQLVRRRRRRLPVNIVELKPREMPKHPNDLWTVDFKGWWRARNGERCEPLTVRDAYSKFVLAAGPTPTTLKAVRAVFERLFRKHGVPNAIQSDNGAPFVAVKARGGLSSLAAWWMSLGIRIVRSRPGCPQDNGGHERMHKDMAVEIETNPGESVEVERRRLERWRQVFNHDRPHEALEGKTPAEVYRGYERRPFKPVPHFYPSHYKIRRVAQTGRVRLDSEWYFVSHSLEGLDVGLEELGPTSVRVWFRGLDLGLIEIVPQVDDAVFALVPERRRRRPGTT